MRRRPFYAWLSVTLAALICSACGGGGDSSSASTTGYLRLVNATQVDNLSLSASTTVTSSGVGSGTASSYASLSAGTYSVIVSAASGALSTSATSSVAITADVYSTVVAYARGGQIKLLAITDNKSTPTTGFASMTVANADSDAGALDIYIVAPNTSISGLSPTFANVSAGGSSLTNSIAAGTYDIVVTAYNKPSDIRLTMPSVALTSTEIVTLALTSTTGGSLLNGALVVQKGSVQLQAADKARVRVVGAFGSNNANLATTVGGTALASLTAPTVGLYTLVPANSSTYTVRVNNTPVASLPSNTFASGNDYTILVYGADSANPVVTILTDNNQAPTSGAKIRLINAAITGVSISLSDNYVPLFSEIPYGTSSEYSGVSTGTSLLQLTSASITFPSFTPSPSPTSGGVYSWFVFDTTSLSNTWTKDR